MCPCCGEGEVSEVLAMWLDILRRAWGEPVAVNSGRRCAADIRTRSPGGPDQQRFSLLANRLFSQAGWEFIPYRTFIHVAVPREESERRWSVGRIKI